MTHYDFPPRQLREALTRFYDGRTTPAEEQALAAYLTAADDVPAEFAADRDVFLALADEARAARLAAMVAAMEAAETSAPHPAAEAPTIVLRSHSRNTPRRRLAVAASIAAVVTLGAVIWHARSLPTEEGDAPAFADTCVTPEEAEAELCRALALISAKTGAGIDMVEAAGQRPLRARRAAAKYLSFE